MKHTIHIRTTSEELKAIHAALLSLGVLPKSHADTYRQAALIFQREHSAQVGALSHNAVSRKENESPKDAPLRYEWLTHIREAEHPRAITIYEALAEGLAEDDIIMIEDLPLFEQLKELGVIK